MNTICSQCGSVLASGEHVCTFCNPAESNTEAQSSTHHQWRGELNQRLQAYRSRRRKPASNQDQSRLPFEENVSESSSRAAVEVAEREETRTGSSSGDDFAFTIAIGRPAKKQQEEDSRLLIDVSAPPQQDTQPELSGEPAQAVESGLFPAASLAERRRAAFIDLVCLAFAYGGFLGLFGSLGGHFTFSKLSAAVCFFTFAFVYLQYFGLFTVFGGTTPGMMIRGLQVVSFSGETPTPRQYALRAVGYLLSAGTLFLGFLWALWDEDSLTWHDRLSRTYLAIPDSLTESEMSQTAAAR